MTALAWVDVAELEVGDVIASIIGYSPAKHPALSTIARQSGEARAKVLSVEPAAHGGTRVVFTVGRTTLARTWRPGTIIAVQPLAIESATCDHCGRFIVLDGGRWIDPEATGDDAIWRETCDANDTERAAPHEPTNPEQNGI